MYKTADNECHLAHWWAQRKSGKTNGRSDYQILDSETSWQKVLKKDTDLSSVWDVSTFLWYKTFMPTPTRCKPVSSFFPLKSTRDSQLRLHLQPCSTTYPTNKLRSQSHSMKVSPQNPKPITHSSLLDVIRLTLGRFITLERPLCTRALKRKNTDHIKTWHFTDWANKIMLIDLMGERFRDFALVASSCFLLVLRDVFHRSTPLLSALSTRGMLMTWAWRSWAIWNG